MLWGEGKQKVFFCGTINYEQVFSSNRRYKCLNWSSMTGIKERNVDADSTDI